MGFDERRMAIVDYILEYGRVTNANVQEMFIYGQDPSGSTKERTVPIALRRSNCVSRVPDDFRWVQVVPRFQKVQLQQKPHLSFEDSGAAFGVIAPKICTQYIKYLRKKHETFAYIAKKRKLREVYEKLIS